MKKTMKKLLGVTLSVCILLTLFTGCGKLKDMTTLADISTANNTEALLETYDSILVTYVDEDGVEYGYYMDSELGYYWCDAYVDDDGVFYDEYHEITTATYQGGIHGEEAFTCLYADGDIDGYWFENVYVNTSVIMSESIQDTIENGDLITYKTKLYVADLIELGYSFDESDADNYYITEYTVNAETLHMQSMTDTFYLTDGTVDHRNSCTTQYNVARPEKAVELLSAHETETALCKVSVVMDVGTEDELTEVMDIAKGDLLYLYWYGDYTDVYLDRECTTVLSDAYVVSSDVTVYLK